MPEQFESKYFSGQGPLFIGGRDANGKPAGLVFVGDVGEVSLTPNIETAEVVENVSGAGGIGSSFTKKTEYQLTINMRSVKAAHLAIALQGSDTAKTASSATDEAIKGYHDKFTPLAHNKVSAVVVTDSTGTTTYVADTDYKAHGDEGLIEVLGTGAITDDQDLLVDYSYAAQHHIAANPQNAEKYLVFAGINRADNDKQIRCEIYKVKLDPGVLGLIQDEHAEIPVSGRVLLDALRAPGDQFFGWKLED